MSAYSEYLQEEGFAKYEEARKLSEEVGCQPVWKGGQICHTCFFSVFTCIYLYLPVLSGSSGRLRPYKAHLFPSLISLHET